jgi:predicted enzyme related to lactoylglutathione lyase
VGERSEYVPGTFSWTDLATTDPDAAKAFYVGLFGWEVEDMPVGNGSVYSMMRMGGRDVAAISPQQQEQREMGVPPVWNTYVTVESADAAAERATELGATVHAGPFDVLEAGRMAVVQDPQGAFFMVWQPHRHIGAGLVNAPGALVWNELASPDLDGSTAFYRDLFGWDITPFEESPQPYLSIKNGRANNGGIRELSPPGVPPHWLTYFGVEDIDSGLAKAAELGGTTMAGPIDIGMAKLGIVQDPQGATFALYAGALEP